LVRMGGKGSVLAVPAALPNIGKVQEGRRSVPKRRNRLTERSGVTPSCAGAPGWVGRKAEEYDRWKVWEPTQ